VILKVSGILDAVLKKGTTLMVSDLRSSGWSERLPRPLVETINARGFVLTSLTVGSRPLGLLYFDTQLDLVKNTDYAVLNQFMLLLRNALEARTKA
jgi:hypothetical protein